MTDAQKRYETERHALFFKEEACKDLYKDHVKFLVNRVNSITGEHISGELNMHACMHRDVLWRLMERAAPECMGDQVTLGEKVPGGRVLAGKTHTCQHVAVYCSACSME